MSGVKNLSDEAVAAYFSKYGKVRDISGPKNMNGVRISYLFVCFESASQAKAAYQDALSVGYGNMRRHLINGHYVGVRYRDSSEQVTKASDSEQNKVVRSGVKSNSFRSFSNLPTGTS